MSCPACGYELASPVDLKNHVYKCWGCDNVYKKLPTNDSLIEKLKKTGELEEEIRYSKTDNKRR
jgi:hypothetical protein